MVAMYGNDIFPMKLFSVHESEKASQYDNNDNAEYKEPKFHLFKLLPII